MRRCRAMARGERSRSRARSHVATGSYRAIVTIRAMAVRSGSSRPSNRRLAVSTATRAPTSRKRPSPSPIDVQNALPATSGAKKTPAGRTAAAARTMATATSEIPIQGSVSPSTGRNRIDPPRAATTTVASVTATCRRRGSVRWVPRNAWSSQTAPIESVPSRYTIQAQPSRAPGTGPTLRFGDTSWIGAAGSRIPGRAKSTLRTYRTPITWRRGPVGCPSVATARDRCAVAGTISAAAISSIARPMWTAVRELDSRSRMIAQLHTTSASDRKVKIRAGSARDRVKTVRPSQRPRTAIKLCAATSSCWGVGTATVLHGQSRVSGYCAGIRVPPMGRATGARVGARRRR